MVFLLQRGCKILSEKQKGLVGKDARFRIRTASLGGRERIFGKGGDKLLEKIIMSKVMMRQ